MEFVDTFGMRREYQCVKAMNKLRQRLVREKQGSIHLWYLLGVLVLAAVAQPSVAIALFYQIEDLVRMLVGQILSLV